MKLAVIGLGPAGLAIAHRASVRGWQVAGWDPQPPPTHVLSVFADELPHWAASLPEQSVSSPVVYTHDRQRICLNRDYLVLDNPRVWKALTAFPVHREAVDADSVTAEDLGADIVIDARGTRDLFSSGTPVQVATDSYQRGHHETVFMDFRTDKPDHFLYTVPLANGDYLQQDTILATRTPSKGRRGNNCSSSGNNDGACSNGHTGTNVFIPLAPRAYTGPHVPYGSRAGFINPFTGYSIATSFRFADPTLDALEARSHHQQRSETRILDRFARLGKTTASSVRGDQEAVSPSPLFPWQTRRFRADEALSQRCLTCLLALPLETRRNVIESVFTLSPDLARNFLILGHPSATLKGMARIWIGLRDSTDKAKLVRAFATS